MSHSTLKPSPLSSTSAARTRILLPIGMGIALLGTAAGIWYYLSRPVTNSNTSLRVTGRIEGAQMDVGVKMSGRVETIAVREGDEVRQGQVLAELDDDELQAQFKGAVARVAAARQQEQQAIEQINVIESQIQEAQITVLQSQQDSRGRVYQAESNMAALEAQLRQAQSQRDLAKVNRDRYGELFQEGAVPRQQFDQAQSTYDAAQAAVDAAQKQMDAAKGSLALAQSSGYNPYIRTAQVKTLIQQRQQAIAQLKAVQADVKNALAAQQQVQAQAIYLRVISPVDGVVTTRTVEPGTVVASGRMLLSILNPNSVYFRGFVPESNIGKVRIGQPAKVFLGSTQPPIEATVTAIEPQASAAPNGTFQNNQVKPVYGIKVKLDNRAGFAKPGMPADVELLN